MKYKSASDSLRPGQLDRLVDKIKDRPDPIDTKNLRNPEYMKKWWDQAGFEAADEIDQLRKAAKEHASEITKWYKKGQMSILRKNKSGCCCIVNDDSEIVSVCGAHEDWLDSKIKGAER